MLSKNPKVTVRPRRDNAHVRVLRAQDIIPVVGEFNETALLVWQALEHTTDINVIAKTIAVNYQIPFEQAYQDVGTILENFLQSELCQLTEEFQPPTPNAEVEPLQIKVQDYYTDYQGPLIKKAGFVMTSKCNLSCNHCYVPPEIKDNMKLEDWKRVILDLKEMGCTEVMIIGGEPLIVPYLGEVLDILEQEDFIFHIDTNGTLFSDELIERLKGYKRLMYVDVSLYGLTNETARRVVNRPIEITDQYRNIQKLIESGITTYTKLVIMRSNKDDLPLVPKIEEEYGFKIHTKYIPFHGRVDGDGENLGENLTVAEVEELLDQGLISVTNGGSPTKRCGLVRCSINSNGKVSICEKYAGMVLGDVHEESLKSIWLRQEESWQIPPIDPKCTECQVKTYCPRCDGSAFIDGGDGGASVPHLCEFAETISRKLNGES